jgi:hypothetical protein
MSSSLFLIDKHYAKKEFSAKLGDCVESLGSHAWLSSAASRGLHRCDELRDISELSGQTRIQPHEFPNSGCSLFLNIWIKRRRRYPGQRVPSILEIAELEACRLLFAPCL